MGVTGERADTGGVGERRGQDGPQRDRPPGVHRHRHLDPEQAAQACVDADGVVVGSAIVRRLLDGHGPEGVGEFVASLRTGIDKATA